MNTDMMARDVAFLRDAVERTSRAPAGNYFLWAVIVALGGAVLERRPEWAAAYWLVAVVVGVIGSALIGWRQSGRAGVRASRQGTRAVAHWLGVAVVTFVAMVVAVRGGMQPEALGALAFLLVALGYFLAGVHGDGSAWAPAGVALLGSLALVFLPDSWLLVGVICGLGLAAIGAIELVRARGSDG